MGMASEIVLCYDKLTSEHIHKNILEKDKRLTSYSSEWFTHHAENIPGDEQGESPADATAIRLWVGRRGRIGASWINESTVWAV